MLHEIIETCDPCGRNAISDSKNIDDDDVAASEPFFKTLVVNIDKQ